MENIVIEHIAFSGIKRGFLFQAWYLKEPRGDALVQIWTDGKYREFLFPAYKIWNITAHADEIIDSELSANLEGYERAAWNGFPGVYIGAEGLTL